LPHLTILRRFLKLFFLHFDNFKVHRKIRHILNNTPDASRNVAVRLIAYALTGLDHFIQVSLLPDLNKMMPEDRDPCHTVIPSTKNCPEYCLRSIIFNGTINTFVRNKGSTC
jgi:hypothetical protein